jgi:L-cysteine:1D-myo-inositol 2-amino-2-deoxy-alpha-D-glucopyranoside ligase
VLSWPAPLLPTLPGSGPALRLFDTARGEVVETSPGQTARMYVCGITPYDATHLGHAATYLAFDLVNRVWRDAGHAVHYVQNVTDVDDPLFERANRDGEDWIVLGMRETALFREDMTALRVLPPEDYVGAVQAIPRIVSHVEALWDAGLAYQLDDGTGDVYHDIAQAPGFGTESRYDEATMLRLSAERGGDPDRAGKRNALDPLLWRGVREGEPSWTGPRGVAGRPGWHVECASIALDTIGMGFDVQGGGSDLVFPHHEYSAVHAEALTGAKPFARAYVHAAMIGLDGEKMSKSRGNLVFVSRLRGDGVDPMAVRLALLSGHYRTDRAWTPDLLTRAEQRLDTWRRAFALSLGAPAGPVLAGVRERLADDLDSPGAIAVVDAWVAASLAEAASGGSAPAAQALDDWDEQAPAVVRDVADALLGIAL